MIGMSVLLCNLGGHSRCSGNMRASCSFKLLAAIVG